MLNKTQFEVPASARLSAGQTLTLEEYKALQQQGQAPDTMNGYQNPWFYQSHSEQAAGKAENRREAKEILGLRHNDTQYGGVED